MMQRYYFIPKDYINVNGEKILVFADVNIVLSTVVNPQQKTVYPNLYAVTCQQKQLADNIIYFKPILFSRKSFKCMSSQSTEPPLASDEPSYTDDENGVYYIHMPFTSVNIFIKNKCALNLQRIYKIKQLN